MKSYRKTMRLKGHSYVLIPATVEADCPLHGSLARCTCSKKSIVRDAPQSRIRDCFIVTSGLTGHTLCLITEGSDGWWCQKIRDDKSLSAHIFAEGPTIEAALAEAFK